MTSTLKVVGETIRLKTKGNGQVLDITQDVGDCLRRTEVEDGIATVFVVGSTAGITTIEYEPGLVHDIAVALERVAPRSGHYEHHERWGDDNGHSHIRASLIGPSITVPFKKKKLLLGTWQQIVLLDFDTRARVREVIVQVIGT
jgi:secondary thiamine-phosphate synthase enzyme